MLIPLYSLIPLQDPNDPVQHEYDDDAVQNLVSQREEALKHDNTPGQHQPQRLTHYTTLRHGVALANEMLVTATSRYRCDAFPLSELKREN